MSIALTTVAAFLRTLGLVAPLVTQKDISKITDTAATLIEVGEDAVDKLKALTAEMKARADAGVTTTAEEILADIERIKSLNDEIQKA